MNGEGGVGRELKLCEGEYMLPLQKVMMSDYGTLPWHLLASMNLFLTPIHFFFPKRLAPSIITKIHD